MNVAALLLLALSALATACSLWLMLRIVPTPRSRRAIIAQYAPPAGVSVLAGAALVNDRKRSISAQLVDLTVRKYLSILPPLTPSGPYSLRFERSAGLDDVEQATVRAFFGPSPVAGTVVVPSRGDTRLLQRLRWAQFRASRVVESSGLLTVTRRRRGWLAAVTFALFVALIPVGWPNLLYALVALGFFIATVQFSKRRVDPLTVAGVDVRDHIVGLRYYITLAEADRFRALQTPEGALVRDDVVRLNERLLGWAVLFGLEKEWAKVLETRDESQGGDFTATDYSLMLAFSSDFSGVASDGNLGGDPNDPNTPDGQADTGDGGGAGGGDSSADGGGDGGGGDGGGGGGGD